MTHMEERDNFLTARWEHLVLANYRVPAELLEPRLPAGLTLDRWDDEPCASLVAFRFADARVFGVRWPFHTAFDEFNLRFYVRAGADRGVMFVREFVPRRAVAWTARLLYNEPYAYAPMSSAIDVTPAGVRAAYSLEHRGRTHAVTVDAEPTPVVPPESSAEHFFKEHVWGFGVDRRGRPLRYKVIHPRWAVHPVRAHTIDVDWAQLYGDEWAMMNDAEPTSVCLAVGSEVAVKPYVLREDEAPITDQPRAVGISTPS
jgi:hypothetical protein